MKSIKGVGNYYGGIYVKEQSGKYYWIIENYDTDFSELTNWTEIRKSLYDELLKYNNYEIN
tara:strand:+ start:18024 stop:18206 length:183 start_codon:yes stop_codon:yes gene_type:complete